MDSDGPGDKKLLVIGASGGIGLQCVREALRRGYEVRAFSRAARNIAITDARLETVNGDATSARDVCAALVGIDVVILALGIPVGPQMVLGPVRLFSDATRIVVDAMREIGIRRLICVTGYGAGDSRSSIGCLQRIAFEAVLGRAYADKDVQEQIIRASDLDWVIVRPGILTNAPKTGRYKVLRDASAWRNGLIARSDVAEFMVGQVESNAYLRATPAIVQ
jgi:putative NADH-flavin reductase